MKIEVIITIALCIILAISLTICTYRINEWKIFYRAVNVSLNSFINYHELSDTPKGVDTIYKYIDRYKFINRNIYQPDIIYVNKQKMIYCDVLIDVRYITGDVYIINGIEDTIYVYHNLR